jgi:excisionase family DNA binding protein
MQEYTVTQAAELLCVSRDTILRRIKRGQVDFRQDERRQYFVMLDPDAVASDAPQAAKTPRQSGESDAPLIAALRQEVAWLREQNEQLTKLVDHSQQLQAQYIQQHALPSNIETPEAPQQDAAQAPKRRHWWRRGG